MARNAYQTFLNPSGTISPDTSNRSVQDVWKYVDSDRTTFSGIVSTRAAFQHTLIGNRSLSLVLNDTVVVQSCPFSEL